MKESNFHWKMEQEDSHYWIPLTGLAVVLMMIFVLLYVANPTASNAQAKSDAPSKNEAAASQKEKEAQERLLTALEGQLKEKERVLTEQQNKLNEQEATIRQLVGVRRKIIKELLDKFSKSKLKLEIDSKTGAIRFSDGIFFDYNRDVISKNGENYLNQFIPAYMSILLSEANRDYIAQIIIEGHTDNEGSYLYNLDLSQRRAYAVAKYIISNNFPDFSNKQIINKYLTANGRSFSEPILVKGKIDKKKSRRVEFKFRLKDDEMIKEMQTIFEGENNDGV